MLVAVASTAALVLLDVLLKTVVTQPRTLTGQDVVGLNVKHTAVNLHREAIQLMHRALVVISVILVLHLVGAIAFAGVTQKANGHVKGAV